MALCVCDRRRAFSLVELLVVIGIIAVLMGLLLPSLARARESAKKTQCLSNMRSLGMAQGIYAAENRGEIIYAGSGSFDVQGSWLGVLERYSATPLVRRCPSDNSLHFETPYIKPSTGQSALRTTSYAINNYVSPTHTPPDVVKPVTKISQVKKSSMVAQFMEAAEVGSTAVADHIHVHQFYLPATTSDVELQRINLQLPVGRHGGKRGLRSGVLNYAFLDGHAESLALADVYVDAMRNRFNPAVAP